MKRWLVVGIAALAAPLAHADVYVLEADSLAHATHAAVRSPIHLWKAGDKPGVPLDATHPNATGSLQLTDSAGFKYFFNTNITFSTSSSASGAASEASYTGPVMASTSAGGSIASTLNDAFDGYGTICVSLTGATGPCTTGNASYVIYNKNGAATVDSTVPATPECTGRQYTYAAQAIGGLSVQRKVYVPTNDQYVRWLNIFTNTTGAPITFNAITSNNLGSDSNTTVVTTSSGDATVTTADTWVTSFQNFSGNTSSDPRIAHVIQGAGAAVPVSFINFVNGDDNPYWDYAITLAPGATTIVATFASGQPTKAAAAAKAAQLAAFGPAATQCMSAAELSQVRNFLGVANDVSVSGGTTATPVAGGAPTTFNFTLANAGPTAATGFTATFTFPVGVAVTAAAGTGLTCTQAANTATCTSASFPVGSTPVTVQITAPAPGGYTLTATVAAAGDTNAANNTITVPFTVFAPAGIVTPVPALGTYSLLLLALGIALVSLRRRYARR